MEKKNIIEYFEEVETTEEYNWYIFSVKAAITISILGTFCGGKRAVGKYHLHRRNKYEIYDRKRHI